jgi:murein DD-endopeptidase MepM/ murein hydrolase activator NlpD
MTEYVSPLDGLVVQSFFGPRGTSFHPGIDVTGDNPTGPVYSMANGTIVSNWSYSPSKAWDGATVVTNNILVAGDDGVTVLYSGLSNNTLLPVGTYVTAGTQIGVAGNTDNDAYHTHIEAITPEGTTDMGLTQGVDDSGNAVWLFNGTPVAGSLSQQIGRAYTGLTRDFGQPNDTDGDRFNLSVLIPPDAVVP